MFKVKDWLTHKAFVKFSPMIEAALKSLNETEWDDALNAFDSLQDLIDAEIERRVEVWATETDRKAGRE